MGKLKRLCMIMAMLLLPAIPLGPVSAADDTADIQVSYISAGDVQLTLEIQGKGTVSDENQDNREGTIIYEKLRQGDEKDFTVRADNGYISNITFNDGYDEESMTPNAKSGKISVKMGDKDAVLVVKFEENEAPKTGDSFKTGIYVAAALGASLIILLLIRRKRKEAKEQ